MKSKYYTPDISEFYVGFEFENQNYEGQLVPSSKNLKKGWHKEVCDSDWFNILFDDWEHDQEFWTKNYRVKYLDSEDLEDLGFIYQYGDLDGHYAKAKRTDNAENDIIIGYHLLLYVDNVITITMNFGKKPPFHSTSCIYSGKIKNKSELKKLLKQLNID